MRRSVLPALLAASLTLLPTTVSAAPVLFGWGDGKVIKVMDFPNTYNFQARSGEYVDVGYRYKQVTFFFIPVWNYDGHWAGYVGSDTAYLELSRAELQRLAQFANLQLPDSPSIPFWDYAGGKLVVLLILGLYIGYKLMPRDDETRDEEAEYEGEIMKLRENTSE